MRKAVAILLVLALAQALPAFAQEKPKEMQATDQVGFTDVSALATIGEVEPNDTAATGSGPLTGGDIGTGVISPAADNDYWKITIGTTGAWIFETDTGPAPGAGDTYMYLYGPDGTTQLAYDDDAGPGLYSRIQYTISAPGTYYVRVRCYSSTATGSYVLNVTAPLPPPPNDTCATAIDIQAQSLYTWTIDTRGALNDYGLLSGNTCTGYSTAGGDMVYSITLLPGETIIVTMAPTGFDAALYAVTNCADIAGTCVDGSDACCSGALETISWQNNTAAPVTYYVICDAYSGAGTAVMTVDGVVPTSAQSWGATKTMYR